MSAPTPLVIAHWATRLVASGILAMGALPKFTGGAAALAERLPGGNAATIGIGLAEIAAIALMLVPKTAMVGSALASLIMLGAIGSHIVGPVGMEGDFATMFVMAIVAFIAAAAATGIAWKRSTTGPATGKPLHA